MKSNAFGRSGKQVSRLGFGAMGLGGAFGQYTDNELVRSVLHSLENGVNLIDTARNYGESERIIGLALREWKGEAPFIASKIQSKGPGNLGWGMPIPVETAYPKGWLRESTEISLGQLGVESIDLMQLHQYWPQWDQTGYWMEELQQLKREGKIKAIGISLPDQRHDIALSLIQSGQIDAVQTVFNIFDPLALDCLIPICQEHQVAVIARCILDEGGLTGFLREDTVFEPDDFRASYFDYMPRQVYINRVNRLREEYVPAYANSLAELAIRFVLHHPGVTTAISSMHIPQYADENISAAGRDPLPGEVFEQIRRHHRWVRNFYETKYWW
ncbi:aldo/keto reductase [Paenibacillus mucilaginosus]|uniref:Aldo/keto reductase n=1 Tax=Paenibacillus mucilaginosus (strain KNP414) TaxID=1036673 RepID=F8F6L5_PAEMK|nr:aldo/keto reductase [Paenibacillus mucilaginosus]AEI42969.1 aldo/keto reductase [Paenibacillus mucilaginosus KNP414]MCG7216080.1 aldo/keto reductase [Paenibacillus mucilaginosus]WDM24598.1 aldo/keto reductase [Paenibacillus mucilaginosus]